MGGGGGGASAQQQKLQEESLALQRENLNLQRSQVQRDEQRTNEALAQAKQARLNRVRGRILLLNDEIGTPPAALAATPAAGLQKQLGAA